MGKANVFFSLEFQLGVRFDVAGYVTGFGNPDWARTHPGAESTAASVSTILRGGATCIGKTVMDEMAYRSVHIGDQLPLLSFVCFKFDEFFGFKEWRISISFS